MQFYFSQKTILAAKIAKKLSHKNKDRMLYVAGPTKIDHVSTNYTELYFR